MNRWRPLVCLIFGGLVVAGTPASAADRYFTWVDEHGQVRQTLIREEANPVEERARQVEQAKGSEFREGKDQETPKSSAVTPKPEQGRVPDADRNVPEPEPSSSYSSIPAETSPPDVGETSSKSSAEVAETPKVHIPESPEPGPANTPLPTVPGTTAKSSAADSEEYNLDNYPDGDELARKGFIREGDPLPYYTWRDAQGNVRVDYYRPEPGFEKPAGADVPRLSSALVLDGSRRALPDRVNRETLAVLGIDQTESLIQSWTDQCCEALPVRDLEDWDDSREFQLDVDELAPEFTFSTGESLYRLVRLPSGAKAKAFVLQLRTYIDHGVFVPTLAFLDKDMQTQRLVTDLVFDFRPESWHSHGFLEARVPVFPARGDHWLLIMSRQEDQAGQTVVETEKGPEVIPHAGHGLLGLAQLGG